MGFSSVNCASGNSALAGGVVGTFINIPFLGDFGPIMGGALTGYATEIYCQNRFVSPIDRSALTAGALAVGAHADAFIRTRRAPIGDTFRHSFALI